MGTHIIPFKGRHHSGASNQNLLWKSGSVYLMDNHRAALWCWLQEIDLSTKPHSILHIDRHYDALDANLKTHLSALPNLDNITIDQFLSCSLKLNGEISPLFRWDNYLAIHLEFFKNTLVQLLCVTHQDGDKPKSRNMMEPKPSDLPFNVDHWLRDASAPWIVNLDLDFFYFEVEETWKPMFSQDYIDEFCENLKLAIDRGVVAAVTVCLTPDGYTPGWQSCVDLSKRLFKNLGVEHPNI